MLARFSSSAGGDWRKVTKNIKKKIPFITINKKKLKYRDKKLADIFETIVKIIPYVSIAKDIKPPKVKEYVTGVIN